jgi:hypothetical protein
MARPIFPHELSDPDFQWLLNSYRESRGPVALVEMSCLPLVMVLLETAEPALQGEVPYDATLGQAQEFAAHAEQAESGEK